MTEFHCCNKQIRLVVIESFLICGQFYQQFMSALTPIVLSPPKRSNLKYKYKKSLVKLTPKITFSAVRFRFSRNAVLQTGQSLSLGRHSLQRRCPLSHWQIGIERGTSQQTGHSSVLANKSVRDIVRVFRFVRSFVQGLFCCQFFLKIISLRFKNLIQ